MNLFSALQIIFKLALIILPFIAFALGYFIGLMLGGKK